MFTITNDDDDLYAKVDRALSEQIDSDFDVVVNLVQQLLTNGVATGTVNIDGVDVDYSITAIEVAVCGSDPALATAPASS